MLVRADAVVTETIAELGIDGDRLWISFLERREDFRAIVRAKMRFRWSWDGHRWERAITDRSGPIADRAAEAGHRLLAAGFVVHFHDGAIQDRAIRGEYAPERTRWICTLCGEHAGCFGIQWHRPDDLFRAAIRLAGARWSRPFVVVQPEHYEEVLDFAEQYDFHLTAGARGTAEKAQAARESALRVTVAPVREPEAIEIDGKPRRLEMPREVEIDDDLADDTP